MRIQQQALFQNGYNAILTVDAEENPPTPFFKGGIDFLPAVSREAGLNFGVIRLEPNQYFEQKSDRESAYVLLSGQVEFLKPYARAAERNSVLNEEPFVLHCAKGESVKLFAKTPCEIALVEAGNEQGFEPKIYAPGDMLDSEHRGKGLLDDTAYRIVRTVFDARNAPHSNLVVGEVVNFPGRWSSYPPHHHPQPEIYFYRFEDERGYGHAELGDDVYKIRDRDTLVITGEKDHAQVAAPGYAMYYLWIIRQTREQPYTKPKFAKEHAWLLEQRT